MKYNYYFFWGLILIGLLAGCSSSNKEIHFQEHLKLKGIPWKIGEYLGRPFDIKSSGDFIILRNEWENTKLTLIDRKHKESPCHFGQRGNGPGELLNPGPLWGCSDNLEVFDGSKMSLLRFEIDSVLAGCQLASKNVFQTDVAGIISLTVLDDTIYVASGVFQEGRFCLLDKTGKALTYTGDYPKDRDKSTDVPFHVLGMAYQSSMCSQPGGNRTAIATRYGSILQIHAWDASKKALEEVACINEFSPMLSTRDINGTPNFRPNAETRWGYLSIDGTERYIFALYSGRFQKENNAFYLGNEVRVFDWKGEPLYSLQLDCEGSALAVKENKLFILSESMDTGEYDIVEYDLPF